MAINVSAANCQAQQLRECADRLQQAKNQLNQYKTSLTANWQGSEVPYMTQGIDKTVAQMNAAIRDLRGMATDLGNAASAIQREEAAAAAAAQARAARQQRIDEAQKAYNIACDELSELNKRREDILGKIQKRPHLYSKYKDEVMQLLRKIEAAEKKCDGCKSALAAARR